MMVTEHYYDETQMAQRYQLSEMVLTAHSCYLKFKNTEGYIVFIEPHWYLGIQHVLNAL